MYINKWNINTAHLQSGNWIILLLLLGLNLDKPFQTVCHCGELLNRHANWIFKFAHYNFLVFTLRIPLHGRSFKKNNAVQYFLLQATLGEREGERERETQTPETKWTMQTPVDPACAFSPVHTVYIYKNTIQKRHLLRDTYPSFYANTVQCFHFVCNGLSLQSQLLFLHPRFSVLAGVGPHEQTHVE